MNALLAVVLIQAISQLFQGLSASEHSGESSSSACSETKSSGKEPIEPNYVAMFKEDRELFGKALNAFTLNMIDESSAELLEKMKVDKEVILHLAKRQRRRFVGRVNAAIMDYGKFFRITYISIRSLKDLISHAEKKVSAPVATTSYAIYIWGQYGQIVNYLKELSVKFPKMRQVMGDGDCFYRSFMFALLMFHRRSTPEQKLKHLALFRAFKKRYADQPLLVSTATLVSQLIYCAALHPLRDYEWLFNHPYASDALVFMLRIMIGDSMQSLDPQFMTEDRKTFIYNKVVQMGKWSGEYEITTAQQIFELSLGITDLTHGTRMVYGPGTSMGYNDIELIFTGNHYDIFEIPFKA